MHYTLHCLLILFYQRRVRLPLPPPHLQSHTFADNTIYFLLLNPNTHVIQLHVHTDKIMHVLNTSIMHSTLYIRTYIHI